MEARDTVGSVRRASRLRWLQVTIAACTVALCVASVALAGATRREAAARVTVTFTDSAFHVSGAGLEAGATTFVVLNKGKKRHVLAITGPGLKGARTPKIAAGKSATLTVTLRAGAYMLSDPVGLSAYAVQYIDVTPAAVLTATGGSSVVAPPVVLPPMCGTSSTDTP